MPPRVRPGDGLLEQLRRQSETIDRLQRLCEQQRRVINECCDIAADAGPKKIGDLEYQCILIVDLCREIQSQADIRI